VAASTPTATWAEIEDAVDALLEPLRTRLLGDTAIASAATDLGEARELCSECGERLRAGLAGNPEHRLDDVTAPEEPGNMDVDGSKVRRLREEQGLSLSMLEERSGVSRKTIRAVEQGQRRPVDATIRRLAHSLGVEPRDLVLPRTTRSVDSLGFREFMEAVLAERMAAAAKGVELNRDLRRFGWHFITSYERDDGHVCVLIKRTITGSTPDANTPTEICRRDIFSASGAARAFAAKEAESAG
jgi:transcriptional regulator with XRE-family HTH domain